MRFHFGLAARIAVLAITNFAVLGLVFAVYVRLQLSEDMKSFLMTAARERIIAISTQLALDLQSGDDRTRLLRRYSAEYGVSFSLFLNDGRQIGGDAVHLPPEVVARLEEHPGPSPEIRQGDPDASRLPDPEVPLERPPELRGARRAVHRGFPGSNPFLVETRASPHYWVGVRMPVPDANSPMPLRGTLLIASSSLWTNSFFFQLTPWLLIGAVASMISVLCWFPFVRGTTRAVHRMLAATHVISTGRFDVDAASARRDELGELGASINRMAAQLDAIVRGQRRFLADAAHELRSPLGRMQLAAGILERKAEPQEAQYIADLREDIEMLSDLTDELLTFARADSNPAGMRLGAVAIAPIIEKAVRMEKRDGADIRMEIAADLAVIGDETMLARSVANLVRNSIRYAGQAGPIIVTAQASNLDAVITVADSGPGIPEGDLGRIFQPFYRLDESRNRRTGGAGLGLAIVKSCVEACGGTISCGNRQPSGLETTLRLKKAPDRAL